MSIHKLFSSESAVAEVLDFVTVMGILLLSVGIISVAGFPLLEKVKQEKHLENTNQDFIVLGQNVNKLVTGQALSQSIEMKMYGGTLSVKGKSNISITATNSSGGIVYLVNNNTKLGSIENELGGTAIAYEGSGIWKKDPGNITLMIGKPLIVNQTNMFIIPVVTIEGTGSKSVGGQGLSRVETKLLYSSVEFFGSMNNLNITISGDFTDGWRRYFRDSLKWNECSSASGVCYSRSGAQSFDVYVVRVMMESEVI